MSHVKLARRPRSHLVRLEVSNPLKMIHVNIYGPMNVRARHIVVYFLPFINNYSRYGYVYLLSRCYEALEEFKCYVDEIKTQ